ncbi:hypothetical protein BV25DRAFT_657136 [Artomyces pyxidatus]|uniref:Uncharacterized protein n=1 Tax=Artomyces pyxidatus TaxID=48021 RepID=A0ACB8T277_9AGAM|nr:hypothetical protein BV25DRAFT_657136 [Artomyces pyxidatus]
MFRLACARPYNIRIPQALRGLAITWQPAIHASNHLPVLTSTDSPRCTNQRTRPHPEPEPRVRDPRADTRTFPEDLEPVARPPSTSSAHHPANPLSHSQLITPTSYVNNSTVHRARYVKYDKKHTKRGSRARRYPVFRIESRRRH